MMSKAAKCVPVYDVSSFQGSLLDESGHLINQDTSLIRIPH